MTDIIQDAKRLLKRVDEERADLESRGSEPDEYGGFEMWLDATVLYDDAKEVREAIKAQSEETWEYQVQTRSQRMPTWSAITDDILQKWYPEDKYNDLIHTGRVVRGGAGFEIRVLRRRVSKPEVINATN